MCYSHHTPAMEYQIYNTRWLTHHKIVVLALFGLCCTLISTSASPNSRTVRQAYDDSNSLLEYPEQRLLTSQQHYNFDGNNGDRSGLDNRKPAFRDCINYTPSVREEQPIGVFVIKVAAIDPDKTDKIEYSFVNSASERPKFRVDARSGDIFTQYQFDRDEPAREKEVNLNGKNGKFYVLIITLSTIIVSVHCAMITPKCSIV